MFFSVMKGIEEENYKSSARNLTNLIIHLNFLYDDVPHLHCIHICTFDVNVGKLIPNIYKLENSYTI